ncbi:MAG: type I methionyl aminopeptidase [Candidatus Marinimicrobia bacterium]|nr:type I methionyl aminopeptidase [Candidatus Neomarinimicrobiota bacterium]
MIHIRNPEEIEKIRKSCRIVADALVMLGDMVEPGVTPRELDTEAEKFIRSRKAEPGFKGLYGFPATLCVSIENEVVHGIPNGQPLEEGQIVGLDVGARLDGYYGDHARTFAVGQIDEARQDLLSRTEECLTLGIAAARPGANVGDIGQAVQEHAESAGYAVVRELVGHGIGTQLPHEIWIALDRKARKPVGLPARVRIVRFSGAMLSYGVIRRPMLGVPVSITSPARTVVDCFRYRNKVGLDVAMEALRDAVRDRIATVDQIWRAAEVCRIRTVISPYLEALAL